jgi:4'-phosphopantetheinyl transferase
MFIYQKTSSGFPLQKLHEWTDLSLINLEQELSGKLLRNEEIHIFQVDVAVSSSFMSEFLEMLSSKELAKANALKFKEDRDRYVAAHGLVRVILSAYTGEKPQDVCFEYISYGKPYITYPGSKGTVQFNMSHSGNLMLLIVSRQVEVGIDVEQVVGQYPWTDIAEQYFLIDEVAYLKAISDDGRVENFFKLWTCKEAYLKARGLGLSGVCMTGIMEEMYHCPYMIAEIVLGTEYCGAIAVVGQVQQVRCFCVI